MNIRATLTAVFALFAAPPALAGTVTDCALRDAPFSIDLPLIDVLTSPAARAVVDRELPGKLAESNPMFVSTRVPSFAAIVTIRSASMIATPTADQLNRIDAALRALPLTPADRIARCARYDNDVPRFELPAGRPRLLLFEKINGFRDGPSVEAAHAAFVSMAQRKGWALVTTDKAGAFNPRTLSQFDAVIWNNISGDVLTLSQRRAFERWLEAGHAYIGVHGSAGDPAYVWDWYADTLIGARFKGHPMWPQFQDARVQIDDPRHPVAAGLTSDWTMNDEWYSFKSSPRAAGSHIIATLDEKSYNLQGMGQDLRMGDHPIAWTRCVGQGRVFYSAIGHRPQTYSEPHYVAMLESGITWAAIAGKSECQRNGG